MPASSVLELESKKVEDSEAPGKIVEHNAAKLHEDSTIQWITMPLSSEADGAIKGGGLASRLAVLLSILNNSLTLRRLNFAYYIIKIIP